MTPFIQRRRLTPEPCYTSTSGETNEQYAASITDHASLHVVWISENPQEEQVSYWYTQS